MKKHFILIVFVINGFCATSLPITAKSTVTPSDLSDLVLIRSNIYGFENDGSSFILDGNLTQFGNFSNNLDSLDIRKMSNFSENIGLARGTTVLAVERRKTIAYSDTIFLKLWNLRRKTYQFEFIAQHMDKEGLQGYLEDEYLHTTSPIALNSSSIIKFSIDDDPKSKDPYRFRLIFLSSIKPLLPVTFTSLTAYQQNGRVNLNWRTVSEKRIDKYTIERSSDGATFTPVVSFNSENVPGSVFQWQDRFPTKENNYYRILAVGQNGQVTLSNTVKVQIIYDQDSRGIVLFPNPVASENVNLRLNGQLPGKYEIRLISAIGEPLMLQTFNYKGGNSTQKLKLTKDFEPGIYYLQLCKPNGEKQIINMVIPE